MVTAGRKIHGVAVQMNPSAKSRTPGRREGYDGSGWYVRTLVFKGRGGVVWCRARNATAPCGSVSAEVQARQRAVMRAVFVRSNV